MPLALFAFVTRHDLRFDLARAIDRMAQGLD